MSCMLTGAFCFLTLPTVMSRNCSTRVPCPENQDCFMSGNKGHGFCICPKGFTLDATGYCRDINECSEMTDFDLCGVNAECINQPGSYECICAPGHTGNGRQGCSRIRKYNNFSSRCAYPAKLNEHATCNQNPLK